MENPFAPNRSRNSKSPQNTFQRELAAKMKDRKRLGLSTDLTPSASERGSDEELASDDDLMAQFNMTNKSKTKSWKPPGYGNSAQDRTSPASNRSKSPYDSLRRSPASDLIFGKKTPTMNDYDDEDEDDDDLNAPSNLMMTMKKPWNPSSYGKGDASKTLPNPKLRKSKAFDHLNEDPSSRDKKEKTWTPPSFKKIDHEEEKENRPQRPKSPNVRGRKTPNLSLDSIEEESKPTPKARFRSEEDDFRRPQPKPRGRGSPGHYQLSDDEDDEIKQYSARRGSPLDFNKSKKDTHKDGKRSEGRHTPQAGGRKTPTEGKVNIFGRQTPDRWTPTEDRRTPDRRTPVDKARKKDGRGTPVDGRKSPLDGRRTPLDGRGTPKQGKKLTFNDDSPPVQKKSMLDMFSAQSSKTPPKKKGVEKPKKKSYLQDSSSEDEGMGAPRRSPSPMTKGRRTPDERNVQRGGRSPYGLRDRDNDEGDEVDGMRRVPSTNHKYSNRESPQLGGSSLRGRSPHRDHDSRSPYGDVPKPRLRKNQPLAEDDDYNGGRNSAFRPTPTRRGQQGRDDQERGRPRSRGPHDDRESSLCRDVENDPTLKKQQEKVKQKKVSKMHTTEGKQLENAIVSVENAQEKTMKFISPDDSSKEKEEQKTVHPETPKNFKHRPKPRYAKPSAATTPTSDRTYNFNSTADIKQAVYDSWYADRMEATKQKNKEKKAKEKELEDKKKKDEEDKYINAKASYQAWVESKKDYDQSKREKNRKEEEKKFNKLQAEDEKRKDADKTYKIWKENKDAKIRENQHKKKRAEDEKIREEHNQKNMKKKDSENAFSGWKNKKDNKTRQDSARERKDKTSKRDEELEAQREQEEAALDSYEKWMERKEKQQAAERKSRKQKRIEEENDPRQPWSPAGRTIPMGR